MKIKYKGESYEMLDAHPAAQCLPWHLDKPEFAELIESVREGFDADKPVIVQKKTGLIISGRRRTLAAIIADAEPEVREVDWTDEQIVEFVRRDELIRRNLTEPERVGAVTKLAKLNGHGGDRKSGKIKSSMDDLKDTPKNLGEIAKDAGVSKKTAERAAKVSKNAPEVLDSMTEGKMSVRMAEKVSELQPEVRKKIVESEDPAATAKEELAKPKDTASKTVAVDAWNIPVQPHAAEAFAEVPKFKEAVKAVRKLRDLMNELAKGPGGIFLQAKMQMNRQPTDEDPEYGRWNCKELKDLIYMLEDATPTYTTCLYEHNDELPHAEDCRTCRSQRWTGRLMKSVINPKLVSAAKAAYGIKE